MPAMKYSDQAKDLQTRFGTADLANALQHAIVHDALSEADKTFVGALDMFWLSTVDEQGMPTVSYKGGDRGFVQMPDDKNLIFPSYDGNGMFYSMGNIAATAKVGLLFMDFEKPYRLRVQGEATVSDDKELLALYPGAQLIVRVAIHTVFQNCPRYVHRMKRVESSRYVPASDGSAPVAGWKRIDAIQPVLAPYDQGKATGAGGLLSSEQWDEMVLKGDKDA